jgi:hypothetical protein
MRNDDESRRDDERSAIRRKLRQPVRNTGENRICRNLLKTNGSALSGSQHFPGVSTSDFRAEFAPGICR